MNDCFHRLFEAQVERTPDAVAVAYKDERLTYRELNRRADQLAHHLRALGAGPETLIGICMERAPEMMVGLIGILKAGAGYLPLDPSYPAERLAYMLEDARTPVVLAQRRISDKVSGHTAKVICVDEDWPEIERESGENLENGPEPDHLAYVIYTSGSTGKPKGVMIHHRGLANYLSWAARYYRMSEGAGTLVHSPIGFDLTITTLLAPLLVGQRVVLLPEGPGIEELARALGAGKDYTLVKITPTHLEALAHMLPGDELAGRVRVLVVGGEMLKWEHIAAWRTYAPATRIVNEYGPTETVVGCCIYEVTGDVQSGSVPIGRAIDNMDMHLLGSDLQPVPPGEIGELYIGGVALARGYLNQPEITREKFICRSSNGDAGARLYKTGDLARRLPDGNLEYLGRTDHQVKIRGYRIELGEIEVALGRHPDVRDCAVVAREDGSAGASTSLSTGKRLVAYVVGKNETSPSVDRLRSFLQDRLPGYMVPSAFVVLAALPLTVNGKVDRDALPSPEQRSRSLDNPFKAATDSLEMQLAEVWEEILGVRPIGITDNFFDLGGDSLQAVLMATKVEEIRGSHIPPSLVIEENTIEKLARAIHRLDAEPRDGTVVKVQPKGSLPPLYLVPGIGGLVLGASYLARRLGLDQPLYGLQARGVRDSESAFTSIEEMASYYIDAIQCVQGDDPFFIAGYSFGGIVAFEIARQLYAAGKRVGMLAILDTVAPGSHRFSAVSFLRNLPHWIGDFVVRRKPKEVIRDVGNKLKKVSKLCINGVLRPLGVAPLRADITENVDMPAELPERYRRVITAHYQALLRYKPRGYPGRIMLFRAKAQPLLRAYPDNGWGRFAEGGVEVHGVEGNHLNFGEEPYVQVLAKKMRAALEKSRKQIGMSNDTNSAP
jgi:amino acid adenylation domain-containing protein